MAFENAETFYRQRVEALTREGEHLRRVGATASRLEQNRVALERARWQLERAAVRNAVSPEELRANDRGGARARTGVAEPPSLRDAESLSTHPSNEGDPDETRG